MQRIHYHRLMARPRRISLRRLQLEEIARTALGLAVVAVIYSKMLGLW